jgi:8-oxo-dGTP pyrophosphatase MutT (NUDIX family)
VTPARRPPRSFLPRHEFDAACPGNMLGDHAPVFVVELQRVECETCRARARIVRDPIPAAPVPDPAAARAAARRRYVEETDIRNARAALEPLCRFLGLYRPALIHPYAFPAWRLVDLRQRVVGYAKASERSSPWEGHEAYAFEAHRWDELAAYGRDHGLPVYITVSTSDGFRGFVEVRDQVWDRDWRGARGEADRGDPADSALMVQIPWSALTVYEVPGGG